MQPPVPRAVEALELSAATPVVFVSSHKARSAVIYLGCLQVRAEVAVGPSAWAAEDSQPRRALDEGDDENCVASRCGPDAEISKLLWVDSSQPGAL